MILTKTEKNAIVKIISRRIPGKIQVYIYGSRTRNIKSKDSDIDILILTDNLIANNEIRKLKIEISEALGGTKIDIVQSTFDERTPFVKLVEEDAVLIWERK